MNINIYSKYEIEVRSTGAYIDQENSMPGDYAFNHFDDKSHIYMSGGQIVDMLAGNMQRNDFSEINFKGNEIIIDFFDPLTGEACTFIYKIKELVR